MSSCDRPGLDPPDLALSRYSARAERGRFKKKTILGAGGSRPEAPLAVFFLDDRESPVPRAPQAAGGAEIKSSSQLRTQMCAWAREHAAQTPALATEFAISPQCCVLRSPRKRPSQRPRPLLAAAANPRTPPHPHSPSLPHSHQSKPPSVCLSCCGLGYACMGDTCCGISGRNRPQPRETPPDRPPPSNLDLGDDGPSAISLTPAAAFPRHHRSTK